MYIHHSVPKSPVCSGGFVQLQLHKADSVCIPGGSRGSTFSLFTGFLLKTLVYRTFIFYYFSLHRQQLWWSRVLHQPLKGTGYLLYCPQNLRDTSILEPQLRVEVITCPFRGPVWITVSTFRRGPLNTAYSNLLLLYTMLLPTEGGNALVDFFTQQYFPQFHIKKWIVAHLDMAIWSCEYQLRSWVKEGGFYSKCWVGADAYLVSFSLYLMIFRWLIDIATMRELLPKESIT